MIESLLPYYEKELAEFRKYAKAFAQRYPKVASQLELNDEQSTDPHVERMIEAFALIVAKTQKRIDDDTPEIYESFLSVLYPHFLNIFPPCSIAEFDLGKKNLTQTYLLERGSMLTSMPIRGVSCKFKTAFPLHIHPVTIVDATFTPTDDDVGKGHVCINLDLFFELAKNIKTDKLVINDLSFFINTDGVNAYPLYEVLNRDIKKILIDDPSDPTKPAVELPLDSLINMGFDKEDALIPWDDRSSQSYRLLIEFFIFPEKFLFFKLNLQNQLQQLGNITKFRVRMVCHSQRQLNIFERLEKAIDADSFKFNCVPIVNLFESSADPIRITHKNYTYPVCVDSHNQQGYEIYDVCSVEKIDKVSTDIKRVEYKPLFSNKEQQSNNGVYWKVRRARSIELGDKGTNISLSFSDEKMDPALPNEDILAINVRCTNRDLVSLIPFGGKDNVLNLQDGAVVQGARLLRKPTKCVRPQLDKNMQWKLISHLSANHLFLTQNNVEVFKELLYLYAIDKNAKDRNQIEAIKKINVQKTYAKINVGLSSAVVRGTEVSVYLNLSAFVGESPLLFLNIIERFLSIVVSVNSFTQLKAYSTNGDLYAEWPARVGKSI